ncbi:MAG: hypothetical protein A3G34_07430 [Candidatus Lindowbacteria bacterium RIFCSPLOWO2_12_FULL_62_27]|nr:MAG: hypothetical protein A3G34_07430 [Candidatus Lindowbacteria bacterium RIFCSPLOWO2_12_FULL_62_27]OGH61876.1 MAG: hypothetical protein A3I06_16775 [Candidatus Lindowbacteria bacterium RIFCSPLOWO2_02_FULL_62_12]
MLKQKLMAGLCERLGPWWIDSMGSSLAWEVRGREHWEEVRERAHVLVFWHARVLLMAYFFRHRGYHVVASENADGDMAARSVLRLGIGSLRGSTSRGASKVLLGAARLLKSGRPIAFTPDGPRGPRHVFQPGALSAARLAGVPVLPATVSVDQAWILPSWDRFVLPRFGARAVLQFLPAAAPPARNDLETVREELEKALVAATDGLDAELGLVIP